MKRLGILAVALLLLSGFLAPASHAFLSQYDTPDSSMQDQDRSFSMEDQDRDRGSLPGYDSERVYPKKSQGYDRLYGDIGAATRPTLKGGEGSR